MGSKDDKKHKLSFEGTMSLSEVLAYLEEFTSNVRSGEVRVERGEDHVVLTPSEQVKLEIEAQTKKHKQSFRLELSWDTPTD